MNTPILITGCQRSGTTLLHLILDSHPEICGIDEANYEDERQADYLQESAFHPYVCFKLPRVAFNIPFIKSFPHVKMLWCVRDPRDVVVSMINLQLQLAGTRSVPWAAHPLGAQYEIQHSFPVLDRSLQQALAGSMRRLRWIKRKKSWRWSRQDLVFASALCWRVKNELLQAHRRAGLPYMTVCYEHLVREPEPYIRQILDFLHIPWHDNLLMHHLLHKGSSIGETDNTRPIDSSNVEKWQEELTKKEEKLIGRLCADTARAFGYDM